MFAPQHLALLRCTWYATSACRRLQSTTPGSRAGRRLSPVLAGKNDFEDVRDLFGDPPVVDEAQGPNSRTSSKKRSEEFRKLGRDLVTLPVRTLGKMALPSDLMEAIAEHARIESKRGTGSVKKGRSRVEALMMGILRSYEPDKSARIEAATRRALAGEPFTPIEPVERPRAQAQGKKSKDHEVAADALARMWHRSLLDGDTAANADVFGSLARRSEEWTGPDRVQLRQLIVKAQSEERDAAAADAAAAAAAAAADEPPRHPVRRPLVARTQLLAALKQLALGSLEDADVLTIDEDEDDASPQ